MRSSEALETLRRSEPDLRARGVRQAAVFGSVARGDSGPGSDAVPRCLEIISEASRRLPDDLKARHPSIGWKQMAGAGNVYRHNYEDVAAEFVWETLERGVAAIAGRDRGRT